MMQRGFRARHVGALHREQNAWRSCRGSSGSRKAASTDSNLRADDTNAMTRLRKSHKRAHQLPDAHVLGDAAVRSALRPPPRELPQPEHWLARLTALRLPSRPFMVARYLLSEYLRSAQAGVGSCLGASALLTLPVRAVLAQPQSLPIHDFDPSILPLLHVTVHRVRLH